MDKLSYALGMEVWLRAFYNQDSHGYRCGIVCTGIQRNDGERSIADDVATQEADQVIRAYFEKKQEEMLTNNFKAGNEFLAENAKREKVISLFRVDCNTKFLKEGSGRKPKATDKIEMSLSRHSSRWNCFRQFGSAGTTGHLRCQSGDTGVGGSLANDAGGVEMAAVYSVGARIRQVRCLAKISSPNSTLIFSMSGIAKYRSINERKNNRLFIHLNRQKNEKTKFICTECYCHCRLNGGFF